MNKLKLYKISLHVISIFIILALIIFCLLSNLKYERLILSFNDLVDSVFMFLNYLFKSEIFETSTRVTNDLPIKFGTIKLPFSFDIFTDKTSIFFRSLFNLENFLEHVGATLIFAFKIMRYILLILLIFPFRNMFINRYFAFNNKKSSDASKPLLLYIIIRNRIVLPVFNYISIFCKFFRSRRLYFVPLVILGLYLLNIYTLIITFVSFYLYVLISMDLISLYVFVYKVLIDFSYLFAWYLIPLYIFFIYRFADRFFKRIGYTRLNHLEMKNRGFINSLGNTIFLNGSTGSGKTKILTDMIISTSIMYRDKSLEMIINYNMVWSNFPFINLERDIRDNIEKHKIYNLVTCEKFINNKIKKFLNAPDSSNIWGYDILVHPIEIYDGLKRNFIGDQLISYAKLYFIYIYQTSYIISNYSIRTDDLISDAGYFPLFNTSIFEKDYRVTKNKSVRSHILDFDSLRLINKIVIGNKNSNAVDFGIKVISEVGKERGNMIQNSGLKKTDATANQKNDGVELFMKMHRHSAVIDGYCFSDIFMDDQRPQSFTADGRDLAMLLFVKESGELELTMPMFTFRPLICDFLISLYMKYYIYKFRFQREDNTLLIHLLKSLTKFAYIYKLRIMNTFGFNNHTLEVQNGRMDGITKDCPYFVMRKKIYSDRYDTACFGNFFKKLQEKSKLGVSDLKSYKGTKATFDELKLQNSYFIDDILGITKKD